jgi:hypothetical protein
MFSDQREWGNISHRLAKLSCSVHPYTLKIGLVPSTQSESRDGYLGQGGHEDVKLHISR